MFVCLGSLFVASVRVCLCVSLTSTCTAHRDRSDRGAAGRRCCSLLKCVPPVSRSDCAWLRWAPSFPTCLRWCIASKELDSHGDAEAFVSRFVFGGRHLHWCLVLHHIQVIRVPWVLQCWRSTGEAISDLLCKPLGNVTLRGCRDWKPM